MKFAQHLKPQRTFAENAEKSEFPQKTSAQKRSFIIDNGATPLARQNKSREIFQ